MLTGNAHTELGVGICFCVCYHRQWKTSLGNKEKPNTPGCRVLGKLTVLVFAGGVAVGGQLGGKGCPYLENNQTQFMSLNSVTALRERGGGGDDKLKMEQAWQSVDKALDMSRLLT